MSQTASEGVECPRHGVAQCLSSQKAVALEPHQRSVVACLGAKITDKATKTGISVNVARLPDHAKYAPGRANRDCSGRGTKRLACRYAQYKAVGRAVPVPGLVA